MKRRLARYKLRRHLRWFVSQREDVSHPSDDQVDITNDARKMILSKLISWKLPHKISELLKKLRPIVPNLDEPQRLYSLPGPEHNEAVLAPAENTLPLPEGRNIEKARIVEKLLQRTGAGVSVVGMTGLGKIALARSIVDDERVRSYFHIIRWAFSNGELNDIKVEACDTPIRSLLVLDGLGKLTSSNSAMIWEDFKSKRLQPETTLLITTRDPRVALYTHTSIHYLKVMSDKDCEVLIRTAVYPTLRPGYDQKLFENKVSHLAEKCMGLPLIARIIGLSLSSLCVRSQGKAYKPISDILNMNLWQSVGQHILQTLKFEELEKPPGLSKLLAYFTLFSHGHIFDRDSLLQQWMAEGFIEPEEWVDWQHAKMCFDGLFPASMIEPSLDHEEQQDPSNYQVLEITRLLAQSIASNMCFRMDRGDISSLPKIDTRHLSLHCQNVELNLLLNLAKCTKCTRLRTFLFLHSGGTNICKVPGNLLHMLIFLRVLDLSQSCITTIPESVGNLKRLRYLDVSHTSIRALPDSICKLLSLRIFKLMKCPHLQYLPKKIVNLVNLIHLDLSQTSLSMPPSIRKLIKLQTLHEFIVKRNKGSYIKELKHMNALQGSIKILQLENVWNSKEAAEASLRNKAGLRRIMLEWTESSMPEPPAAEQILHELQPHQNLEHLVVTNYNGSRFPKWLPSFHDLQIIHLDNCPNCSVLPLFWQLPILRTLRLDSIGKFEAVDRDFLGVEGQVRFPALEVLEFHNMMELQRWDGLVSRDMPSLTDLKIIDCPQLTVLCTLKPLALLATLESVRCRQLKEAPEPQEGLSILSFDNVPREVTNTPSI